MRSLILVSLMLVGCGDEDRDSVTKAVEAAAHASTVSAEAVDESGCIMSEDHEPLSRQSLERNQPETCAL